MMTGTPSPAIVSTIHGFSLEVNPSSFMAQCLRQSHTYEPPETELVKRLVRPGNVCIDVGAHVGYFTLLMASFGASVLSFEAHPRNAQLLLSNITEFLTHHPTANILAYEVAISDEKGSASFYLPSEYDDGWGSLAAADVNRGTVMVPTNRLDHYPFDHVRFLKMDIEGAELHALRGLGPRIFDIEYLLIECIDQPQRAYYGSSTEGVAEYMRHMGFKPRKHVNGQWLPVFPVTSGTNYLFIHPDAQEVS